MSNKHTLGPWYESNTGNHQGLIICEKTGDNIAVAYDKKNARLIAAAPELLTACVYALNELKHPHPNPENKGLTVKELEQAITKAEG